MENEIKWNSTSDTTASYEREERDLWCRVMAASIGDMNGRTDIVQFSIEALAGYADESVRQFRKRFAPVVPARETRDAEDSCAEFKIGAGGHRDCAGDGHYRCRECAHFLAPREG